MPAAARKTATKPKRLAPVVDDDIELLELVSDPDETPVEMTPAFSLDGTVFCVPTEVDAAVAIRYLDLCRKKGENYALSWLLEEVLGTEAYEALLGFKGLKDTQLAAVVKIVQSKVMGDVDSPKGSQRR